MADWTHWPGLTLMDFQTVIPLIVALIGVIGVMVAQGRAFERQADEQKKIRAEESIERRRTASLADRRVLYAKFLRAKRRLPNETLKRQQVKERFESISREPDASLVELGASAEVLDASLEELAARLVDDERGSLEEPSGSYKQFAPRVADLARGVADLGRAVADMKDVVPLLEAAYDSEREAIDEADLALLEIYMLAPLEVVDAAVQWHHHSEANDPGAQARFFNAARQDVGVQPLDHLPV